jgi:hypothetical protein
MKISSIVAGIIVALSVISSAGDLVFHLAKHDTREISRESMVKGRLQWSEDEGESIAVTVYAPGDRIGELKSKDIDLQQIYDAARADTEEGPFYSLVDEYIVGDGEGRYFLVQYEYQRPGADFHLDRFRIGRLVRIVEGADLFFLVDYMQDSDTKALTAKMAKMAELGRLKLIIDRRGQEYRMLLNAAGEEEGENKANKSEMATPRKPSD